MSDWSEPAVLEARMKEIGGPSVDIDSPAGKQFQTLFLMSQAVRLAEQVDKTHKLARSTFWMAFFVGVASLAQLVTAASVFFLE